ncbi:MAG: ABC transporter ATP-binding protein [Oscillospiraceae bacterium]
MAQVLFKNVRKVYGKEVEAVCDFNLTIADKEFVVFVGPSGCGKSTTLRMVAGLEEITSGEIFIGDKLVNDVLPKDRDISMVFQNYALYPHMTVYDNIAFSLKMHKMPKKEIKKRVLEAAEILDITELLKRKPKALSGGQRQRVAIGRSIVREPQVFLMDEPLSNLDAKLRNQMRTEIIKLRRRLDTTFIYVTHDQTEAMTLGDRIVVMDKGYIKQVGTPNEVYNHPENMFVAGFIGTPQMNFIDAVLDVTDGRYFISVDGTVIELSRETQEKLKASSRAPGDVVMGIRPEHLHISDGGIAASADVAELTGGTMNIHSFIGNTEVISVVMLGAGGAAEAPRPGQVIHLEPDVDRIHLFDKASGESLLIPQK